MQTLSLESAATIVDAALQKARALNLKPMSVAVLDGVDIWSRSSAKMEAASCAHRLPRRKPGAAWAWASAAAPLRIEPPLIHRLWPRSATFRKVVWCLFRGEFWCLTTPAK